MTEVKEVVQAPNYTISIHGDVVNTTTGKTLKPSLGKNGYYTVTLCRGPQAPRRVTIHRLLGLHFLANPENKRTINHKDGNKANNTLSNLEWATYSENIKHAYDTGLHGGCRKLSESELLDLFDKHVLGESFVDLALSLGVSTATITENLRVLMRSLGREAELDDSIQKKKAEVAKVNGEARRDLSAVKMICPETMQVVKTFEGLAAVKKFFGKSCGPVSNAISGFSKLGYGYHWVKDGTDTTDYMYREDLWKPKNKRGTGYRGVYKRKDTGRYKAEYKGMALGNYSTELGALAARNTYVESEGLWKEIQTTI